MSPTAYLRPVVVLFALAPLASSGTLTVGPAGSGAQFTEIQAAINAAFADDVILVRPGTYAGIVVEKPLRILGDGTGTVRIQPPSAIAVSIKNIGSTEELVLSGVEVRAQILVQDCPGTVVLQDVVAPQSTFGMRAENCARVLILDCMIRGVAFDECDTFHGAVFARATELWIANSDITGTKGSLGFGQCCFPLPGVDLSSSTLHAWRSRIQGGGPAPFDKLDNPGAAGILAFGSNVDLFGGPGTIVAGGPGTAVFHNTPGGPAVDLRGNSHARIQDDVVLRGGLDGQGLVRAAGVFVDGTSMFTLDPKVFPTLVSSAHHVQLGSPFTLTLEGNPGGYQVLFLSLRTGPTTIYRFSDGFGLLDRATMVKVASEVLPPSGSYAFDFHVPNNVALLGSTLFFQAAERLPPHPFLRSIAGSSTVNTFAIGNPVLVTVPR